MIDNGGANDRAPGDDGKRWGNSASLMQIVHNLGIQTVGSGATITKTYDVQRSWSQQFQLRLVHDAGRQRLGQRYGLGNDATDRICTICLQGEPGLQGTKPAREVRSVIARPPVARRTPHALGPSGTDRRPRLQKSDYGEHRPVPA